MTSYINENSSIFCFNFFTDELCGSKNDEICLKLDDILSSCNKTNSTDDKSNCYVLMTDVISNDSKNEGFFSYFCLAPTIFLKFWLIFETNLINLINCT